MPDELEAEPDVSLISTHCPEPEVGRMTVPKSRSSEVETLQLAGGSEMTIARPD